MKILGRPCRKVLCLLPRMLIVFACLSVGANAQWLNFPTPGTPRTGDGKPNMTAPVPRAADGKPDLSGIWGPDRNFIYDISSSLKAGETLPIQPWAAKLTKERMSREDPEANCLPAGVPRMAPYPWKIVQTPSLIVFLFEGNIHSYRQIFMDGRSHPKDMNPTWFGDSIGRWEGDTLVVDSVGFNNRPWVDSSHSLTEKLHLVERYRRPDLGHLELEMTAEDAGALKSHWTIKRTYVLDLNDDIMESVCTENERDAQHILPK